MSSWLPPAAVARWAYLLVLVSSLSLIGLARPLMSLRAERRAAEALSAGRLFAAESWIDRARAVGGNDLAVRVLTARIHRHREQQESWERAVAEAEAIDADAQATRAERRMGTLRWGSDRSIPTDELGRLIDAGVPRDEASLAVAMGYLASGRFDRCERLLSRWERETGVPQQPAFVRGVWAQIRQEWDEASGHFGQALRHEPEHEMARAALAQLSENRGDFDSAAEHFEVWASRRPEAEQAVLGWSRVLRRLGRAGEAETVLERLGDAHRASREFHWEATQVAFELGHYDQVIRRLGQVDLGEIRELAWLVTAATSFALEGDLPRATLLSDYAAGLRDRERRLGVLRKRVENDPTDRPAVEEFRTLVRSEILPPDLSEDAIERSWRQRAERKDAISPLFSRHCAACHGEDGQGLGPASRHLYPPARNLRHDAYRLVSSTHRLPTLEDIEAVIRDGIPGTSMPSFAHLPGEVRRELSDQVYRLRLAGLVERRFQEADEGDRDTADPDRALTWDAVVTQALGQDRAVDGPGPVSGRSPAAWLRGQLGSGHPLGLPPLADDRRAGPDAEDRLADGRRLYREVGCVACHGDDGRGETSLPLSNEDGSHAIPRDLAREPMKGGDSRAAIFTRIRLGMPGTPHPAHPTLTDDEVLALVAFCRSLAVEEGFPATNHERFRRSNRRAMLARFADEAD